MDSVALTGGNERDRLRLALDAGRLGVWEWDRRSDQVTWDAALERLFGIDPGQAPKDLDTYVTLLHPDDREQVTATITAALERGEDFEVEHRVVWPDGTVHWIQGRGHPVHEGDEIVGLIGVCGDITAQRWTEAERDRLLAEESAARAEADAERSRLEFIIEAKAALSELLDLDDRLNELSRLSIPRFADGSAVHLLDDHGELQLIALHHRDEIQAEIFRDLFERFPVGLDDRVGVGAAIREGRSGWLPEVTDEMLVATAVSDQHLALLRKLDMATGLVVPLLGPAGPFGAITFVTTGGRRMRSDDLVLVEQLCSRVAVLLRNSQLIEAREQDRRANHYQAALLQSMFEASVDGILVVGDDGEVLAHNQRFLQLWDLPEHLIEQGDDALLAEAQSRVANADGFVDGVKAAYEQRPAFVRDEVELVDGRVLDRNGMRLTGPDGEYLGFVWSFRDVTIERAQATALAEAAARSATLARTLQQSLLPPRLPEIPGLDLAARYRAAGEGLEVGGDFYDVFSVGSDWMLVIGDVCGKGAEAAALTALARYTVRASANHNSDPCSVLTELNAAMLADPRATDDLTRFATVCCIRLRHQHDAIAADIACGGHPPPLVLRNDGTIEQGGTPGTLLGVFEQVELTGETVMLAPGESVVAVTDGVLEASHTAGEQFGDAGMRRVLAPLLGQSANDLCQALETAVLELQQGLAHDDVAVLIARVNPPQD